MTSKRTVLIILFFLLVTAVLAACSANTETVEVEVTRVVTETVEVEGEAVEVTIVVTETEIVEVEADEVAEEPAEEEMEEEAMEEEADIELEDGGSDDVSATGSEDATGDSPPPPDTGPKVETERTEATPMPETAEAEARSAESDSDSVTEPIATSSDDESVSVELTLDQGSRLTAGEVDDNAQWDDYLLYLRNYSGASVIEINVSERHQMLVNDSQGNPILGARIGIEANGQEVMALRTHSNGRANFYPKALPIQNQADEYTVNIAVNGLVNTFTINPNGSQREYIITHTGGDQLQPTARLDVLFLIDATGSMADEIFQLKENIRAIAAQIDALPVQPDVRFGMVTYRDRGDAYLTNVTDFTPNVEQFAAELAQVEAAGGGDYPEDLNEALSQAIHQPEWRVENTVSLVFLVADAPPHLDYGQENHYAAELMEAAERGIKIYPIASSGLDSQGEYVFRQLAQVTNGRFIFLTYGAEGAGSTGTETDLNVSDYTVSSLDGLVVKIVEEELAFLIR
ncbi:MAG: VWA domain-containing protein [Chloroflexi bacterium]|nr:VWA domain-containing protein [Chloroflexota bacterium]